MNRRGTQHRAERTTSRSRLAVLLIVLVAAPAACGSDAPEVFGVSVREDGTVLEVEVQTCNDDSMSVEVAETDETIQLTTSRSAQPSCGSDDCNDIRLLELDQPVGDRTIVDRRGNVVNDRDS